MKTCYNLKSLSCLTIFLVWFFWVKMCFNTPSSKYVPGCKMFQYPLNCILLWNKLQNKIATDQTKLIIMKVKPAVIKHFIYSYYMQCVNIPAQIYYKQLLFNNEPMENNTNLPYFFNLLYFFPYPRFFSLLSL